MTDPDGLKGADDRKDDDTNDNDGCLACNICNVDYEEEAEMQEGTQVKSLMITIRSIPSGDA